MNVIRQSLTAEETKPTLTSKVFTLKYHSKVCLCLQVCVCSCTKPHQWVLHVTDHHTKYSWLFALHNKTAQEVLAKLQELFWLFGFLQTLHTDNSKEFKNNQMQKFCQNHGIQKVHGAPRKPSTLGLVERNNRTAKENLTNILKKTKLNSQHGVQDLGK